MKFASKKLNRRVKIRTLNGKTVPFMVNSEIIIFDLKQRIEHKLNIPSQRQRLVYHAKRL